MLFIIFIVFLIIQTLFYKVENNKLVKFIPAIIISIVIIFSKLLVSILLKSNNTFPKDSIFSFIISLILTVALIGDLIYIYINYIKEKKQ